MDETIKLQNARNFVRSEIAQSKIKKMDKHLDYEKIMFLEKLLNKLI